MKPPLVSVIIPVFNGEEYLGAAIRSVLAQDHSPIETIVVDDGSTDGSAAVAERFDRVITARRDRGGPGAARNTGLDVASGSYITFLDADDLMMPNRVSAQFAHLERDLSLDGVFCLQRYVVEPGATVPRWIAQRSLRPLSDEVIAGEFAAVARGDAQPLSVLIKSIAFDEAGRFEEGLFGGEDSEWLFRARRAGVRFGTVEEVLMERRIHGSNLTYEDDALARGLLELARHKVKGSRQGSAVRRPPSP